MVAAAAVDAVAAVVVVAVDEVGEAVVEVVKRGRTSAVVMHKVPAAMVGEREWT